MGALTGLLALADLVGVLVVLVLIYRDLVRDKRDDTLLLPARRRRRIVLIALLTTLLLPAIGARRGVWGVLAGIIVAGGIWAYTALVWRRLR